MSSQTSINISSGEANRSGNDVQGPPQDRNQPETDTIEDLRKKLQALEKKNLELTNQHNQDMSHYEKQIMKLRLELERGEALRRVMESEMSFSRKDAQVQMYSAEDELCDAKAKLLVLQEPLPVRFLPEAAYSRPLPASASPCDASWGEPRHRYCTLSGTDIPSGGTLYLTCPSSGTNITSVHWVQPVQRTYVSSESDIPSGGTPYGISSSSGTDTTTESVPSHFITRGVSTPVAPVSAANWRELSNEVFTSGAESGVGPSYSRHFGPVRPATNETTDSIHYRRSDSDLYDCLWINREPSLLKIPLPSGRNDKTYSLQRPTTTTYVQVCPSRIGTLSWLDDSSRIRPLSTFTTSTPSWERVRAPVGSPVRAPVPVNAFFRGRPRRSHSLPPFKSISQDTSSNTRSIQEI